eukprot:scaffold4501_cov108-Isochrysis_galbana.AAC.13
MRWFALRRSATHAPRGHCAVEPSGEGGDGRSPAPLVAVEWRMPDPGLDPQPRVCSHPALVSPTNAGARPLRSLPWVGASASRRQRLAPPQRRLGDSAHAVHPRAPGQELADRQVPRDAGRALPARLRLPEEGAGRGRARG